MGVFPKMVGFPQQTHRFSLLKVIIKRGGCEMGVPSFKETPLWIFSAGEICPLQFSDCLWLGHCSGWHLFGCSGHGVML